MGPGGTLGAMSDDLFTPETFEPHVGTEFELTDADARAAGVTALRLDGVERRAERAHGERTTPFSLVFSAAARLPQRTYEMHHPALGDVAIFVVPIAADASSGRTTFEAVFN